MSTCRSPHEPADTSQINRKKNALIFAILLSLAAFVGQLFGSYFTGSLALLGDTAHVFTDVFSLIVSLVAIILALRPATQHRSFGLYRLEVLAAFLNGILLVIVGVGLIWEAVERLLNPSPVLAIPLVVIAFLGLVINLISAWVLSRAMVAHTHLGHDHGHSHDHAHGEHHHNHEPVSAGHHDRNLHGALLHVLTDALGSFAVVVGAIITYYTDWLWVDPALAIVLSVLILRWSLRLLYDSGHVLLEGTPRHMDAAVVSSSLKELDTRVQAVDDLHIWEITSRMYAATAEVRVGTITLADADELRGRMHDLLKEKFGIAHVVLAIRP